jgi:hypothetical protein
MARGFESKDVEFQQAEADRSKALLPARTAQEREALDRRQTLALALACAEADLAAATSSVHRQMLEQVIAALRGRLGQLGASPSNPNTLLVE